MKATERVPNLQLVPTERIRFHEHPEPKRTARLVKRLREETYLRNPPIVTALGDGDYVLLDGANRVSAFRAIGWSHVPVQVIDYARADVQLKGWHHLLLEAKPLDLRATYEKLAGIRLERIAQADIKAVLELRRICAALVDDAATVWGLFPVSGAVQLDTWMPLLGRVVAAYEGKSRLERIKFADYEHLPDVFENLERQLVLFPTISKVELIGFVRDGISIPTGVTRHLIPGRALGMNLPLAFLETLTTETAKQEHFRRFVADLEMAGRVRYYEESVFLLSE